MPRLLFVLLATCLLLGIAALSFSAAEPNRLVQMGAPVSVGDRDDAVQVEIAALGEHEWAGDYYSGDGLGVNIHLSLAPTAGVVATWTGCMGLYGSNEGIVTPQPDGTLQLAFHQPNRKGFGGFDDHLQPVIWGERHYLIPVSELEEFVSAINFGDEPRRGAHGFFLLRRGDEQKAIEGLPNLPTRALAHIRSEPLLLTPVAVTLVERVPTDGWCTETFRFEFARGSADGVAEHMSLRPSDSRHYERLTIVQAGAHHASGELRRVGSTCEEIGSPDTSWEFSTGAYQPNVMLPDD